MKPNYSEGGGTFLKAGNVESGDFIKFLDGGTEQTDGKFGPQMNMKVFYKGEEKTLTLNKTNYGNLSPHYGEDLEDWIGKTAVLTIKKYEGFPPGIVLGPCISPPKEDLDKTQESIEETEW